MSNLSTSAKNQQRVIILGNRRAGAGGALERVHQLVKRLTACGLTVDLVFDVAEFREIIERTPPDELRCVVAAGGDGTAELVANMAGPTPVTVFPMGTENLLAKHFGMTQNPDAVAETVLSGQHTAIDIGLVGKRQFLLMLSCGFDAEVVRRLDAARAGNINHLSYAKPIMDSIRSYRYPSLTLTYWPEGSDEPQQMTAYWVFVFNMPTYAGGLGICPDAIANDGLLDIVTLKGNSFWHGLYHFSAVVLRRHRNLSQFASVRARRVRIESESEVPYQIDGDPGGFLPVDVEVAERRLNLLVPRIMTNTIQNGLNT